MTGHGTDVSMRGMFTVEKPLGGWGGHEGVEILDAVMLSPMIQVYYCDFYLIKRVVKITRLLSGGILRERKKYRCIRQSYVEIRTCTP